MARILSILRSLAASRPARWIGVPLIAAAAVATLISQSQTTLPPALSLAAEPLYARGARAKPTITLALSVEFPTVGAQYVSTPGATTDSTYATTTEYLGYFDADSCYLYNNGSTASDRYFYRTGAATSRACGGSAFSGNFMNWATGSAIDILRYGLTGGDRIVDTTSLTVLQRAVLPTGFYNSSNFPAKILSSTLVDGAVPSSVKGTYTGNIYIANCLDRLHFGTQQTGSCATPGNNSNLGVPVGGSTSGPVTSYSGTLPSDFSASCATEGNTCSFSGIKQVAYGANSSWNFMSAKDGTACTNGVFGDPLVGTPKACYTRTDPTGWNPGGSAGITSDNFFYSRVRVCESDGSGNLTDPRSTLCRRYPNGNYKPVGNLQKYSDKVRVAAFGYLNDNTAASGSGGQRYGGVLRAPMKYVGPKKFDSNFNLVSGANAVQEWSESTGVFVDNPDSASEGVSGVTNYLNRFGRTGTAGQYKTYDPVGELYYESLRYLQGLSPTPEAVSSITTAMKDGYPVYDSWTDPHPAITGMTDYSCVKNNIIAIGDVNTHSDRSVPGNTSTTSGDFARTASVSSNLPNFKEWTKIVGAFEEGRSETYIDGEGASQTTSNPNTANSISPDLESKTPPCCNNNSYYMAGTAYWANTHDIRGTDWSDTAKRRPGMRVTTYILDVNEYGNQSVTATRRNNQFYLAAKYGGFKDLSGTGNPFLGQDGTANGNVNWERQTTDTEKKEAKNYFLSSSAKEVLESLDTIFKNITDEANSIAGGAISTQRLTSVGGFIYQAQFDPSDWSGDLVAYSVDVSGTTVSIGDSSSSPWQAATQLDARVLSGTTDRNIIVGYNSTATTPVFNTTEFKWDSLNTVTKEALQTPAYAASGATLDSETVGQARLNYLRGERSQEAPAGTLRTRGSRLGDIVNSGVAFSGTPVQRFSDSAYASFYSTYQSRTKALFVGANDGMLHAFNADTGDELFAYIPSWLAPDLSRLTSTAYTHQSFLDGSPVVAEANLGTTASGDWRTVLVSGTGGGGQGVFALDISNPAAFDNDKVLWEFSDKHDPAMGNVIGRPHILKLNVAAGGATPDYRYFAVVASGVNNYVADGSASLTGKPAIFLLRMDKAKSDAWVEGGNYYKIEFPVSSTAIASGMAGFTVRLGSVDEVSYLYAGDLQGNMWKLDFTKADADDWNLDTLSFYKNSGTAIPMFVAQDSESTPNRQPITMEPTLVFGPNRTIVVAFGTGKYLEVADNAGPHKTQTVYAILDNLSATADTSSPQAAISGRGRLKAGAVDSSGVVSVDAFNWGRPTADGDTTARSGWYFDFYNATSTGERQVSGFAVLSGKLIFGTVIPAITSCDSGSGNLYIVDLKTGGGTATVSTVGILGEPFIVQVGASTVGLSDSTGARKETARYQVIVQGSSGVAAPSGLSKLAVGTIGRLSWREVSNYQEVRNTP